jgi:hypothetical protein
MAEAFQNGASKLPREQTLKLAPAEAENGTYRPLKLRKN